MALRNDIIWLFIDKILIAPPPPPPGLRPKLLNKEKAIEASFCMNRSQRGPEEAELCIGQKYF